MGILYWSDRSVNGKGYLLGAQVAQRDWGRCIYVEVQDDEDQAIAVVHPDVAEEYAHKLLEAVRVAREAS